MRTMAALMVALALSVALVACSDDGENDGSATATPSGAPTSIPMPDVAGEPTVTASGLQIYEITVGTGQEAVATDTVTANYTGWLEDGTMFDSSIPRGEPTQFSLSEVIQGWTEGVPGMQVGGKRRLVIPPDLAYGADGAGSAIPPNATLTFDIELVSIP